MIPSLCQLPFNPELSSLLQSALTRSEGGSNGRGQKRIDLYTGRFIKFLLRMDIKPLVEGEERLRLVLLGYAEFVYSAGFCTSKKKSNVKVKNVDIHVQFAADYLFSLGFEDIRYVPRSVRSNRKPRFFRPLQRLRENIMLLEAPVESAIPLEHTLFVRMLEKAKVEICRKKRRCLLLICISFTFLARSHNIALVNGVRCGEVADKRITLRDVTAGDDENLFLNGGHFHRKSMKGACFATLHLQSQKNGDVGEKRSRGGDFWIGSLLTLVDDMRREGANPDTPLSDYVLGSKTHSIKAAFLSATLREFAKEDGVIVRNNARRISSHSCRASGAVLLFSLGYDAATIQLCGNWKSLAGMSPYLKAFSLSKLLDMNEKAVAASPMPTLRTGKLSQPARVVSKSRVMVAHKGARKVSVVSRSIMRKPASRVSPLPPLSKGNVSSSPTPVPIPAIKWKVGDILRFFTDELTMAKPHMDGILSIVKEVLLNDMLNVVECANSDLIHCVDVKFCAEVSNKRIKRSNPIYDS